MTILFSFFYAVCCKKNANIRFTGNELSIRIIELSFKIIAFDYKKDGYVN
jgi:hypothetical protein